MQLSHSTQSTTPMPAVDMAAMMAVDPELEALLELSRQTGEPVCEGKDGKCRALATAFDGVRIMFVCDEDQQAGEVQG